MIMTCPPRRTLWLETVGRERRRGQVIPRLEHKKSDSPVFPDKDLQRSAFQLLLHHGASWQEVDATGNDALMRAATWGDIVGLRVLFRAGATVGQKTPKV